VRSVSLRGKRLSDVDVERARLLHQYALHGASTHAQRLADLQYARATLVEAQDALFRSSSTLRSPCFLLVLDDFMKQNSAGGAYQFFGGIRLDGQ
jgi:hypothetical protein